MPQFFKNEDAEELKFYNSADTILEATSLAKDDFFDGAYACFVLGELLFDNGLSPLANAIDRTIFRQSFATIFEAFVLAGTFESYLTVFRKIFGEDVDVTFTVPAAGKLNIDIVADEVEESPFVARSIVDNAYVQDAIIDDVGDSIVFQTILGFQSEYELNQMLHEMVPNGISTEITLSLGA